jgi:hypothetical protein
MKERLVFESVRHFTVEEIQKVLPYNAASYHLEEELRELTTQQASRTSNFRIKGFAQHKGTGFLWGICFLEIGNDTWLPVSHFIHCTPDDDGAARDNLRQTIKSLMSLPIPVVPPEEQAYIFHGS